MIAITRIKANDDLNKIVLEIQKTNWVAPLKFRQKTIVWKICRSTY